MLNTDSGIDHETLKKLSECKNMGYFPTEYIHIHIIYHTAACARVYSLSVCLEFSEVMSIMFVNNQVS